MTAARIVEHMPDAKRGPHDSTGATAPAGLGLTLLAAVAFLALSVVYLDASATAGTVGRVISDVASAVPLVMGLGFSAVARRRSTGIESRFWTVAVLLTLVLLASDAAWSWWMWTRGTAPPAVSLPFQLLNLACAILFLQLLATMVRLAETPAPIRLRWWLDLLSVSVVVYVVALRAVVEPLFVGVAWATPTARLVAAAYTTAGVMTLAGAVWVLVRPGFMRWRLWERLIAFSIIIYAAGSTLWPFWFVISPPGSVPTRGPFDLILVFGQYLFAVGAAQRVLRSDDAWPMRRLGPHKAVSGPAATYLALGVSACALPVLVAAAVLTPLGSLDQTVFAGVAGIVAILALVRTIVSAIENGRLFHTATSDPLTGLHNHRYFHERLAADLGASSRFAEPLAVVWVDLDGLGRLNRLAGHAAGDDFLRTVAAALAAAAPEGDAVCRVGGDEFAIVARGCDADGALTIAATVEDYVRSSVPGAGAPQSVSGGIALFVVGEDDDPIALASLAERTAEWAGAHARGRIVALADPGVLDLESEGDLSDLSEQLQLGTLRALATAVDVRREASGTRAAAVAALSGALARHLGLDAERVRFIEAAALVHDIGMVGLRDDVLAKPGPLEGDEVAALHAHPALGQQILGASESAAVTALWIRHHHERWDGSGYPDSLRAVAIPLESRILGVCDAWAAMTSDRPYRPAMTHDEAAAELRACAGTQFDPALVEAMLEVVEMMPRS